MSFAFCWFLKSYSASIVNGMRLTKRPFCLRRIPHGHESRPDDRVHFVPANQLPAAGHVTQTTIATMLCEK